MLRSKFPVSGDHVDDHAVIHRRLNASSNVLDYGATGDGETDDTAAIQAAIDVSGGAAVYFPAGVYRCGLLAVNSIHLCGRGATIASLNGGSLIQAMDGEQNHIIFEGLDFNGFDRVVNGDDAAKVGSLSVTGCGFSMCHFPVYWQAALDRARVTGCRFEDCTGYNVLLGHQTDFAQGRNIVVTGNQFLRPGAGDGYSACVLTYGHGITIANNTAVEVSGDRGFYSKGQSIVISDNAIHTVKYVPDATSRWVGFYMKADGMLIADNIIHTDAEDNTPMVGVLIDGDNAQIAGNYIAGCREAGILGYSHYGLAINNNTIVSEQRCDGNGIKLAASADAAGRFRLALRGNIVSGYRYPIRIHLDTDGHNISVVDNQLVDKEAGYPCIQLYLEPGAKVSNVGIFGNVVEPGDDPTVWLTNFETADGVVIEANTDDSYLIRESVQE